MNRVKFHFDLFCQGRPLPLINLVWVSRILILSFRFLDTLWVPQTGQSKIREPCFQKSINHCKSHSIFSVDEYCRSLWVFLKLSRQMLTSPKPKKITSAQKLLFCGSYRFLEAFLAIGSDIRSFQTINIVTVESLLISFEFHSILINFAVSWSVLDAFWHVGRANFQKVGRFELSRSCRCAICGLKKSEGKIPPHHGELDQFFCNKKLRCQQLAGEL